MLRLNLNSITILEHTYNHKYSRCVSQPFSQSVAYSLSTPPSFTPFQYTSTTQQKKIWEIISSKTSGKGGHTYIPLFEGGPLGYPADKKPGSKCQIFHPPQKIHLTKLPAPMFAGLYLDAFRNPLVSPDGKIPPGSRKGWNGMILPTWKSIKITEM